MTDPILSDQPKPTTGTPCHVFTCTCNREKRGALQHASHCLVANLSAQIKPEQQPAVLEQLVRRTALELIGQSGAAREVTILSAFAKVQELTRKEGGYWIDENGFVCGNLGQAGFEEELDEINTALVAANENYEKLYNGIIDIMPQEFRHNNKGALHSVRKALAALAAEREKTVKWTEEAADLSHQLAIEREKHLGEIQQLREQLAAAQASIKEMEIWWMG